MALASELFALLHQMDDEAETTIRGLRTGLVDYAGHRGIKTRTYEVPIYRRLAELLGRQGYAVETGVKYPDGSGRCCDIHATTPSGEDLWLELKVIWREWLSTASGGVKTSNFESYITGPGKGRLHRNHSLAQDFEKLEELQQHLPSATAATLAICFDAVHAPLDDVILGMEASRGVRERGWLRGGPEVWSDRNSVRHRIACWAWVRTASAAAAAFRPGVVASTASTNTVSFAEWERLYVMVESERLLQRSSEALRRWLAYENCHGSDWSWEQLTADVLELPENHEIVREIGKSVRQQEKPYRNSMYNTEARVREFVLERFRVHIRAALQNHRPGTPAD